MPFWEKYTLSIEEAATYFFFLATNVWIPSSASLFRRFSISRNGSQAFFRVGEITGLRWEDCDFTENTISINHNLVYCKTDDGKHRCCFLANSVSCSL